MADHWQTWGACWQSGIWELLDRRSGLEAEMAAHQRGCCAAAWCADGWDVIADLAVVACQIGEAERWINARLDALPKRRR